MSAISAAARREPPREDVRVVIVDDSAVVRGLASRWLREAEGVDLVGHAVDGARGIEAVKKHQPDVVILDVEMPIMGGIEALPQTVAAAPNAKVVMASTLTQRNADVTIKALSMGAADYLPKPETKGLGSADNYRRDLIAKVTALGRAAQDRRDRRAGRTSAANSAPRAAATSPTPMPSFGATAPAGMTLHKPATFKKPDVLVVGSSTGGPQALQVFLAGLGAEVRAPIFIVQHMPKTFTRILAEHLNKISPHKVVEAEDGMPARSGQVYVAPGDHHMTLKQRGGSVTVALDQRPPVNFCRPAVDPLFESAAKLYGPRVFGAILTGMGADGCEGARAVTEAGGAVSAQDEASSVVWGMPGAVTRAGLAARVEPVDTLAPIVISAFKGQRP